MGDWGVSRREYIESRQVGWLSGVADALRFLHERLQLLHCDVKAGNVLIFEDGRTPKLADFGPCLLTSGQRWQGSITVATQHGVCFTHRYQAPEQESDDIEVAPAADVWAFALLAFEILFATRVWGDVPDSQAQRLYLVSHLDCAFDSIAVPIVLALQALTCGCDGTRRSSSS
eukprot:687645-Rhodomonas_salina.2